MTPSSTPYIVPETEAEALFLEQAQAYYRDMKITAKKEDRS
jgi:hypothetical protein